MGSSLGIRTDGARRLVWRVVLYAALPVAVLFFNAFTNGPVLIADGTSYFANAAALAGHRNDMASSYHAGYSILISPAFWFADTPGGAWRGVLAINSTLFLLTVFLLTRLSRIIVPAAREPQRYLAVLLVSLYPMWVITAGYSIAHNAFVPIYLLLVLMIGRSMDTLSPLSWFLAGILAGFLYWVHPTALPVLVALAMVALWATFKEKNALLFIAAGLGLAASVFFYTELLVPWLRERMTLGPKGARLHYPEATRVLSHLLSLERLGSIVGNLGGHAMSLIVGSAGLVVLGIATAFGPVMRAFRREHTDTDPGKAGLHAFLLLSFFGVLALSLLFFSGGGENKRVDHWMYGRYVEGVFAPLLLLGLLRGRQRWLWWGVPLLLASVLLCVLFIVPVPRAAQPLHFSAFWPFTVLNGQGFVAWGLAGCSVLALLALTPRWTFLSLVALLFVGSSHLHRNYHVNYVAQADQRRETLSFLRDIYPPGSCIGFDPQGMSKTGRQNRYWYDGAFLFYDYSWVMLSSTDWRTACPGPLVSFDEELLQDEELHAFPRLLENQPIVFMRRSQLHLLEGEE